MNDELIIKYIKKKKEKGLELFVDKYSPLITFIVRKHLYNLREYEEECIDDVFLCVWDNIHSFDKNKNSLKNWVAAITKYKAIDYKRKYLKIKDFEDISELELLEKSQVEDNLLNKELKKEIEELLNKLKPEDREIFIKHYLQDEKIENISVEVGMSKDKIYNRLSRGRNKLRKILSKEMM